LSRQMTIYFVRLLHISYEMSA